MTQTNKDRREYKRMTSRKNWKWPYNGLDDPEYIRDKEELFRRNKRKIMIRER
jgi:hypothetical protein